MEILHYSLARDLLSKTTTCKSLISAPCRIIACLLLCLGNVAAPAAPVTFDFRSPATASVLDNAASGTLTAGGLIMSLSAMSATAGGAVFNQTASRFGINSLGSAADSSSLVDAVNNISEYLSISFSDSVWLEYLHLSSFTPAEQAQLYISGGPVVTLTGQDAGLDIYHFQNYSIHPGQQLILSHALGNGFSVDTLAVSLLQAGEPPTLVLLLLTLLLMLAVHKRQNV